ncbi:MAG: DUF2905 domain-containing protein [Geobacter sp.]|jgi:hypothetical protein|uniref:DUF2905 domain-containing protein n=1 Tax=Trichlorobacter sp. TaxID=2911007 RepID=UPI002A365AAB|nr:DUF2905 domain-containing protein [Trichlorobacter sp.]MDY0385142.1 DUF2905 domain-containing protein [Trichlorobacter sp.]
MPSLGRSLIMIGLLLVAVGVVVSLAPRIPWLGKLPGDIFIRREQFSFYMPLTTSLLVSLALSLLFWLLRR